MIVDEDRSKRASNLEAIADEIVAAGHGKEFKNLLHETQSPIEAINVLKAKYPSLVI